jgi:hypothetical protein
MILNILGEARGRVLRRRKRLAGKGSLLARVIWSGVLALYLGGCRGPDQEGRNAVLPASWPVWDVVFSGDGEWLATALGIQGKLRQAPNIPLRRWSEGGVGGVGLVETKRIKESKHLRLEMSYWAFRSKAVQVAFAGGSFSARGGMVLARADEYGSDKLWTGHVVVFWRRGSGNWPEKRYWYPPKYTLSNDLFEREYEVIFLLARCRGSSLLLNWHGEHWERLLPGTTWELALSPDGKYLAVLDLERPQIRLYEIATKRAIRAWTREGGGGRFCQLVYSPEGNWLAVGGEDGVVYILAADLTKWVARLEVGIAKGGERIKALAFSPGGDYLVAATRGCAYGYALPSGRLQQVYGKATEDLTAIALSPDGQLLAIGHGQEAEEPERSSGYVEVYETRSGRLLCRLE